MGRCRKEPKKKYSQQQLLSAIEAVKNKGLSQFAAAKKYAVPRSTLFNKITGKTQLEKKPGPSTVLLAEEERIIEKWMFELGVRGFPVTKRQLLRSIQLYLNLNKRKTIFKNNLPGRKWYDAFRARHPQISERISQNLTISRAAVSVDKIKSWHAEVLKYCEEHKLVDVLNDPSRVFNMDEKGFVLTPTKEVVLVRRGDKAVYNRSKNDEKECVTALLGGSAAGKMTPPMIVHAFKRMPAAILLSNPEEWSVGISDSGWQTQQTFHDYMTNIFYKWLLKEKIQLPVILFIDGHKSHVSLALSDFCATHQIELIALYPNSTHLTQPMDVGVFKSLNSEWSKTAKDWRVTNKYAKIERKDVAGILNKSIGAIKYSELLKSAFKACGIFPFNAENIDFSRVLPSITASATPQEELWIQPKASSTNDVEVVTPNNKNAAVDRLQHFECLLGESTLNLFRASADDWTGAIEYSVLFTIWKTMYKEAAQLMSVELSEVITIEVEASNGTSVDLTQDSFSIVDGDNYVWLMDAIDNENIIDLNTISYQEAQTDNTTSCEESSNAKTSIITGQSLPSKTSIDVEHHFGKDLNGDIIPPGTSSGIDDCGADMGQSLPSKTSIDVEHHFGKDLNGDIIPPGTCSGIDCGADAERKSQISAKENAHLETASIGNEVNLCPSFDADAFKEAFFWPTDDPKQIKKKKFSPKISSVMSSDHWREHERMKLEEKLHQQAEKDARKAVREAKKLESTKIAAEKLRLKEQKMAATKLAAQNRLVKRLEQNQSKIRKRSDRATKLSKKL